MTSSLAVVQALCLNRSSCSIPMSAFGAAPCAQPHLAVQATPPTTTTTTVEFDYTPPNALQARCADGQSHTYWHFSDMDSQLLSFWQAFQGDESEPIVGFCTAPSWLYDGKDYTFVDDAATWW